MIKFNKFNVTDGTRTARVSYSAFKLASTGEDCVTLYAKDATSGRILPAIFEAEYQNDSDAMSDYYDNGRVRLKANHPLYAEALKRCWIRGDLK